MPEVDVVIAGGGPVGLAAAIEARLAGLSVAVYEPRPFPVDKACGEGLMPSAVEALTRLGVRPGGHPFAGIRYADGQRSATHRFRSGLGLGVRRTVLHDALVHRAVELGAELVRGSVVDVAQDEAGVVIDLVVAADGSPGGTERISGAWLLACDGLHSGLRRSQGLSKPAPGRRRFGQRQHFRVAPWSEFVEVHWTPAGEVYVTPVADDLVGVAVLADRGARYDDVLAAAPFVVDRLTGAPAVSDLHGAGPLHQRTAHRTSGRVLLVGDAAGYVDALTGEGIALGLRQAHAAVGAVRAGRPGRYEREWTRITRDYRLLTRALTWAASRPRVRRRIVPLAERLPTVYGAIVERLAG